eukprot:TRINITY_DN3726_c0_g2_i1.p1 TRINITY_DN3726_c0_g2~~TRINITY_DN3726_c0_g2_i1.p1  ORF type:complete len:142 (-),score=10.53 TRINITY_DN3726_c0_g2_i1:143-568(-)
MSCYCIACASVLSRIMPLAHWQAAICKHHTAVEHFSSIIFGVEIGCLYSSNSHLVAMLHRSGGDALQSFVAAMGWTSALQAVRGAKDEGAWNPVEGQAEQQQQQDVPASPLATVLKTASSQQDGTCSTVCHTYTLPRRPAH